MEPSDQHENLLLRLYAAQRHLPMKIYKKLAGTRKESRDLHWNVQIDGASPMNSYLIQKDVENSKYFMFGRTLSVNTPELIYNFMAHIGQAVKAGGKSREIERMLKRLWTVTI